MNEAVVKMITLEENPYSKDHPCGYLPISPPKSYRRKYLDRNGDTLEVEAIQFLIMPTSDDICVWLWGGAGTDDERRSRGLCTGLGCCHEKKVGQKKGKYDSMCIVFSVETDDGAIHFLQTYDWLIKDQNGNIYPCRQNAFKQFYELI